jgi:dethiobiotin synthetase
LLSLEAMRRRLIPVLGVAFIGEDYPDTQKTIEEMGDVRILGRLPYLNPLTAEGLRQAMRERFDVPSIREAIT